MRNPIEFSTKIELNKKALKHFLIRFVETNRVATQRSRLFRENCEIKMFLFFRSIIAKIIRSVQ